MKRVALSEVKDDLSRYLRLAAKEELVITRHGRAAGVLIGFESEEDWFDYRLESDPRFLNRIAVARASLQAGRGVRLEDVDAPSNKGAPPNRGHRRVRPKRARSRSGRGG
ncbi:MAG: type II toxin-antitoxin system Phd/YefM family antitoxin [Candidatus Rokubacteria bacterium]|nr:type II toxin-antitoxin system Phd/YefM family antitoxin [Candidatus Rokubacteria bacterium]